MNLKKGLVALALCVAGACHAATLASYTAGTTNDTGGYYGVVFTISGTGSYNDIALNLYTGSSASYAIGTGYLFASQYTGTPNNLASASGALGSAVASGGAYTFSPSLMLMAGTTYYFYENALIPGGAIVGGNTQSGTIPYANTPNTNFVNFAGQSLNYRVTGDAVTATVTPEPSSFALLGTGLLSVAWTIRRRVCL